MKKDVLIYFDLITSLKTTQEVDNLSSEIDMLMSKLFQSEKILLEKALTSVSVDSAKKITEIFEKFNLDMTDKAIVRDFLDTLADLIKKFKVIKLILAFDPTRATIENIHEAVSENIGIGYILDIEVDESVLAGAIVIFNGKYKDYTIKKAIEETFQNKKQDVLKFIS